MLEDIDEKDENKEVKAEVVETEETVTISKSDLADLIDSKIKAAASDGSSNELIKELVAGLSKNNQEYKKFDDLEYMNPADIDPKDRLDEKEAVTFWAAGLMLVIGDDKKGRQPIPAPYGIILFKPEGSKIGYRGKDVHIQMWCKYTSWSKKEVEFLKNHKLFGSRFFLKSSSAMTIDVRYAQQLANYAMALRSQPMNQIIDQARALNIVVSDDLDTMRLAIATIKAKEYMDSFAEGEKIRLKENSKEALISD